MKLRPLVSTLVMAIALVVTIGLVQQRQIFQKKAAPLITNTTLSYIHQDQLGSTALVTDANGSVVSRKAYYPYGSIKSSEGQSPTERGYTGQVSDADQTGLLYYNARYYDPVIAKFTQADKAADTLNKYAYVGNNPINNTDPTGNMTQPPMHDFEGFDSDGELKGRSKGALGKANPVNWNYPGNLSPFGPYNVTQTYASTVLALDVAAIGAPIALSCAANPVCVAVVAKVASIADSLDTIREIIGCAAGNALDCTYVANPMPGASFADDLARLADDLPDLARLGKYTLFDSQGRLIVDAANDPILGETILEGVEVFRKDNAMLTETLSFVKEKIPYRFNNLTNGWIFSKHHLGEYICTGGVCKQQAALLNEIMTAGGEDVSFMMLRTDVMRELHLGVFEHASRKFLDPMEPYARLLDNYFQRTNYQFRSIFKPIRR